MDFFFVIIWLLSVPGSGECSTKEACKPSEYFTAFTECSATSDTVSPPDYSWAASVMFHYLRPVAMATTTS